MKKLLVLLSSFILVGCATPSLIENTEPRKQNQVFIDPEILKECNVLQDKLEVGDSFERTLVLRSEDIKAYYNCLLLNSKKKQIIEKYLLNETKK